MLGGLLHRAIWTLAFGSSLVLADDLKPFCNFERLVSSHTDRTSRITQDNWVEWSRIRRPDRVPSSHSSLQQLSQDLVDGFSLLSKMQDRTFAVPKDRWVSQSELEHRFPHLRTKRAPLAEAVEAGFQKDIAYADFEARLHHIARSIFDSATPAQRTAIVKRLIEAQRAEPASWGLQSKLDSFIYEVAGVDVRGATEKIRAKYHASLPEGKHVSLDGRESSPEHGPRFLLTPINELDSTFGQLGLKPGQKVVDLGSGMGTLGVYLAATHPDVKLQGYEWDPQRVATSHSVSRNLGTPNVRFDQQNLLDPKFELPSADVYYAFNPGSPELMNKLIADLKQNAEKDPRPFRLVFMGPPERSTLLDSQLGWMKEVTPPGEEVPYTRVFQFEPKTRGPKFRPLETEEMPMVQKALERSGHPFSILSPASFPHWAGAAKAQVRPFGPDGVELRFEEKNGATYGLGPFGVTPQVQARRVVDSLVRDPSRKVAYLNKDDVTEIEAEAARRGLKVMVVEKRDCCDYTYSPKQWTNPGELGDKDQRKNQKDRNKQAERFWNESPEGTHTIALENSDTHRVLIKEFLDRWIERRRTMLEQKIAAESDHAAQAKLRQELASVSEETGVTRDLLNTNHGDPNRIRLAIQGPNGLAGIALGEVVMARLPGFTEPQKQLIIHVKKSDSQFHRNTMQALAREIVTAAQKAHPDLAVINMMDDAGDPGLRDYKSRMGPTLIQNFEVSVIQ